MVIDDIQNYPSTDSPNHDAFEGIVELFYEINGYITSSGKWFWKMSEDKQQRGYQDIDVLAINGSETIIVSVSSNFDDKLNYSKGVINPDKSSKTIEYFKRVETYLANTDQYHWLVDKRAVKKVIAVINAPKDLNKYNEFLKSNGIEIKIIDEMITEIIAYLDKNKNLKIQNQTFRFLQILNDKKLLFKDQH